MTSPSSLQQYAIQSLCKMVEKESTSFYSSHPVAIVSKNHFESSVSLFSRIFGAARKEAPPAGRALTRTYDTVLMQDSQFLSPRVLAAVEKRSEEFYRDRNWQRLFENRWGPASKRPLTNFKTVYLVKHFLEAFAKSGCDVRKIPQSDLALFVENASFCLGIELLSSDIYLTDEILHSIARFMPKIEALVFTGRTRVTSRGLSSLMTSDLKILHLGCMTFDHTLYKALKARSPHLESLDIPVIDEELPLSMIEPLLSHLRK